MLLRYCFFRDALLWGPYLQKAKLPAEAECQPSPALCHSVIFCFQIMASSFPCEATKVFIWKKGFHTTTFSSRMPSRESRRYGKSMMRWGPSPPCTSEGNPRGTQVWVHSASSAWTRQCWGGLLLAAPSRQHLPVPKLCTSWHKAELELLQPAEILMRSQGTSHRYRTKDYRASTRSDTEGADGTKCFCIKPASASFVHHYYTN